MTEALYLPAGVENGVERFKPTEHCVGPWADHLQHAGPPIGLLTRAMDRLASRADARLTRITTEILGAILLDEVEVTARVERPGRRIELLSAEMRQDGRPVARAAAWRLRTLDTGEVVHHAEPTLPAATERFDGLGALASWSGGFVAALDWLALSTEIRHGETTKVWTRLRPALVAGEAITDLERVAITSDVANGVGARLDPARWTFLNTETTLHLYDPPSGELVGLAAETSIGRDGVAMSSAVLSSVTGPIGRVTQNSLVERR
ncbi:thioesterase family protein [Nocardioides sp.]|uniref:thioesterase family protein n=1 Tax=Nocardioides sp. TaxID=35761 RepID=UPI0039E5116A